jgi:hypothetical protein
MVCWTATRRKASGDEQVGGGLVSAISFKAFFTCKKLLHEGYIDNGQKNDSIGDSM